METRVHRSTIIQRKSEVKEESNYRKYEKSLKEDFQEICGYCGKRTSLTTKGFEIDHFVPVSFDKSKKIRYDNLVYSCFTCNRKKSSDWPTKDTNLANDGVKGYVDPATSDFDNHLGRDADGRIVAKTQVGKYMMKKFKFDKRPMQTIYKLDILLEKKKKLDEFLSDKDDLEKYKEYFEIQKSIDYLMTRLFNAKE